MKKVRITVLKTTLDQELAKEYGVEGLTSCPMMRPGQVFYYRDWIRKPGVSIVSCNDVLRPVIFKLEKTQEESL